MNPSAKTRYACLAMLELASRHADSGPVPIGEIAKKHNVPERFLVQILLQLKRAGLVNSTRGAAGGYRIAQVPDQIPLGRIMEVMDGRTSEAIAEADHQCDTTAARVLQQTWLNVAHVEEEMLNRDTLADLLDRMKTQESCMYYI